MIEMELDLPQRQRLLMKLQGLRVPAEGGAGDRDVVHALQRVGMVGAQRGASSLERLPVELQRLGISAEGEVAIRHVVQAVERGGVVLAKRALPQRQGLFVEPQRLL